MTDHPQEGQSALEKMVDGMCMTWRHDFGIVKGEPRNTGNFTDQLSSGMTEKEREALRASMRQLIEHNVAPVIDQLERELADARKDAERLNWMIAQSNAGCSINEGEKGFWLAWDDGYGVRTFQEGEFTTARASIDAAMKDKT